MARVGKKRLDRRWKSEDGTQWDSQFECEVYEQLKEKGYNVRRCTPSDTVSYSEPKPRVTCSVCGSTRCLQERTYTPDLYLVPKGKRNGNRGFFIEVKGYFRAESRALFRCLRNVRPDVDIRFVAQADFWVTRGKTRISKYFATYLKNTPFHVWDGDIPEDWK